MALSFSRMDQLAPPPPPPLVLAPTSDELEPSAEAERELKSKLPHNAEVTPRHGGEETEPLRVCRESGLERESPICPITPAHLLFGVTSIAGVVCPILDSDSNVDRAWRSRRRACDRLIRRWTTEYLQTLRCWSASPRGRPVRLPAVGGIVLVQGEGRRGTWPLARVETLIPGPDGRCRAAFIRVRGRLTRRPISRLFRLEASPE